MFLFSLWQVYQIYSGYAQAEEQYEELEQFAPPVPQLEPSEDQLEVEVLPEKKETSGLEVDFAGLSEINSDVVGWLYIEGTQINYPVVQGADNDYYLNHQFDKRYNSAGCLFLDRGNDSAFGDQNQIIYGHYMKNKSMFHDVTGYKEQSFYDAHPHGWLITPEGEYQILFFSGYVSDTQGQAWKTSFAEEATYGAWLEEAKGKSSFVCDVVPDTTDQVLTLSTCSYEFQNARYVLHGILKDTDS